MTKHSKTTLRIGSCSGATAPAGVLFINANNSNDPFKLPSVRPNGCQLDGVKGHVHEAVPSSVPTDSAIASLSHVLTSELRLRVSDHLHLFGHGPGRKARVDSTRDPASESEGSQAGDSEGGAGLSQEDSDGAVESFSGETAHLQDRLKRGNAEIKHLTIVHCLWRVHRMVGSAVRN